MKFVNWKNVPSTKLANILACGLVEYIKSANMEVVFDVYNVKDDYPYFTKNPSGNIISYKTTNINNLFGITGFKFDYDYVKTNKIGPFASNKKSEEKQINNFCIIDIIERHLDQVTVLKPVYKLPEFRTYYASKLFHHSNINHLDIAENLIVKSEITNNSDNVATSTVILKTADDGNVPTISRMLTNTCNMLPFTKITIMDYNDLLNYVNKLNINIEDVVYTESRIDIMQPSAGLNITKSGDLKIIKSKFANVFLDSKTENKTIIEDLGVFNPYTTYSTSSRIVFQGGDPDISEYSTSRIKDVLLYIDDNPCDVTNPNYSYQISGGNLTITINPPYEINRDTDITIKLMLDASTINFPKINISNYYTAANSNTGTASKTLFKKLSFYTALPNCYLLDNTKTTEYQLDKLFMTTGSVQYSFNLVELANAIAADIEWVISNKNRLDKLENSETAKFNIINHDTDTFIEKFLNSFLKFNTRYTTNSDNIIVTRIDGKYKMQMNGNSLLMNKHINTTINVKTQRNKINISSLNSIYALDKTLEQPIALGSMVYKLIKNEAEIDINSIIDISNINKKEV